MWPHSRQNRVVGCREETDWVRCIVRPPLKLALALPTLDIVVQSNSRISTSARLGNAMNTLVTSWSLILEQSVGQTKPKYHFYGKPSKTSKTTSLIFFGTSTLITPHKKKRTKLTPPENGRRRILPHDARRPRTSRARTSPPRRSTTRADPARHWGVEVREEIHVIIDRVNVRGSAQPLDFWNYIGGQ